MNKPIIITMEDLEALDACEGWISSAPIELTKSGVQAAIKRVQRFADRLEWTPFTSHQKVMKDALYFLLEKVEEGDHPSVLQDRATELLDEYEVAPGGAFPKQVTWRMIAEAAAVAVSTT